MTTPTGAAQPRTTRARSQPRRLRCAAAGALAVLAVVMTGCATPIQGQARSSMYDPNTIAGVPVVDGPSGVRKDAPPPEGKVAYTNNSDADHLAVLAVNDVVDYWQQHYTDPPLEGSFTPVANLASYDSTDPGGPILCGESGFNNPNAFYCPRADLIAWDRGDLVPAGMKYFGDASIAALFAHEYGHAVQRMGGLVDRSTPTLVLEQQADCFAGSYIRWVTEGSSKRFQLNTSDGLNRVIAGVITIRDPILTPEHEDMVEEGHGTALDRVSAFQTGFIDGIDACARIDMDQIEHARGDLPMMLDPEASGGAATGESPIDQGLITSITEALTQIFTPAAPPTVSLTAPAQPCPDATATPPVSYCPSTNTITVDLPALQAMGTPADEKERVLLQGDNTAISVLTARYMLALQHHRGVPIDTTAAALRTACLTGVAQRKMTEPITLRTGGTIQLSAGDLDEAIAGLLNNGFAASDVNGTTVAAGFTRIMAFRSGLITPNADACYTRFP
ncbi:neutral zinc metallopeptidase [Mycobacterium rufum]|uniref:Neutral zinc metallopeptidase n=2 Tax=Mycolicibacterium rufum TaxID=318424 RepID=A0A9X2YFY4_9MYCO|nr:neutral zinc metallopeptidase [Mycolicibacterium rufum]